MRRLDLADIDTSGLTLIEASAGTGKTWTITALYLLLLLEERLRPEEILVVTYTRAATAELRERIRKRIVATLDLYAGGREPADELERLLLATPRTDGETARRLLTRALYAFDDSAIFTIHGFCQRALLEHAFESGSLFDAELTADQSALVRQACDDFWRTRITGDRGPFLERLIGNGYTPERLALPFTGQYQNPFLRVVPETAPLDLAGLTAQRDALLPGAAAMWRMEREAIIGLLRGANLSQTSYKPERIGAAALKLDALLGEGTPHRRWDCLELFTTARIEGAMKKGSTRPEHPFFGLCQELHDASVRVDNGYRDTLIQCQAGLGEWLRGELARRKRLLNLRSYDDLLLDLHLALEGAGGERLAVSLRERYRAALIDEFQDTDPLQWRIFARMAGVNMKPVSGVGQGDGEEATQAYMHIRRGASDAVTAEIRPKAASYPLFLIGDPKQAIYSFRGADIHAYLAAARAVDGERRWTLDTNRRSTPGLVAAVNTLFSAAEDPFLNPGIRFNAVEAGRDAGQRLFRHGRPVDHPLRFWLYRRRDQSRPAARGAARSAAVAATAGEIARLLDGAGEIVTRDGARRPLTPGDIAVLVKAHYQADQVQAALAALGVPSVQHGSSTIFESREALDLLRILRAAAEPARGSLVREALLTSVIGLSANELFSLLADEEAWETWLLRFRSLRDAALAGGVIALAARLLGECGVRRRTLARADGARAMTNILQCAELLHRAEREQGRGLEGSIAWLERRITGEEQDETYLLRLDTDANAVTIATIHASKGLEYPVVFLPVAWEPPSGREQRVLFHDDAGGLVLDLGSDRQDDHRLRMKEEQEAEAARLLYVALTRAEHLCCVVWGNISGAFGSPLARLLHGSGFRDAKAFGAASDGELLEAIAVLAAQGDIAATDLPADAPAPAYRPEGDDAPLPVCRELRRAIPGDWRVSSFSAITAGGERHLQPRDHDAVAGVPSEAASPPAAGDVFGAPAGAGPSMLDFPKGAAAGTCLHELFERLDFSAATDDSLERLCLASLLRNGYDRQWLPAVRDMVREVISAPLLPDDPDFSLSRLTPGSWLTEMEFFLPLVGLSAPRLRGLFDGMLDQERHGGFGGLLASLELQESRGMLQGFVDMLFEHNGRYFLIDWKSNHLGDRCEAYRPAALREPMARHAYILQYHLYTLALDRLLRLRLPGYAYETHFGGAIYVFLRGISAAHPGCGIYRDRPAPEFIRRAEALLLAEGCGPRPGAP
ncbi:MAG TPA: UvrD-helicase domain-containing protein [Desulfuromonadaceae bacterium]